MSKLILPPSCFYFFSVIYRTDLFNEVEVKKILQDLSSLSSLEYFFPNTEPSLRLLDYYKKEMGGPLHRVLYTSLTPSPRDEFSPIKVKATHLEDQHSSNDKRTLNIDVGQVTLENMQLASGKMYAHRVYLKDGVYSDLHYQFKNSSYEALPWCYPDYAQAPVIEFFNHLRSLLLLSN